MGCHLCTARRLSFSLHVPIHRKSKYLGVWGQQHLWYIKEYRKVLYTNLLTRGRLDSYLRQARDTFFRLIKQMAEREGITEQLKAKNQMEWVGKMNNIRNRVTEIVNHDIIYA